MINFNPQKYEQLYPDVKDYNPSISSNKHYRLYDHYLKFGKELGYAGDHKSLPVFYHIPKCGGTSVMHHVFLRNIDRQYDTIIRSNGLYLISLIQNNDTLLQLVCCPYNKITDHEMFSQLRVSNNRYRHAHIEYSQQKIEYLCQNFDVFTVCVKSYGLKKSNEHIDLINKYTCKYLDLYILLRNPSYRCQSEFYYLKDMGAWEPTAGILDKNISFTDYLTLNKVADDFVIRNILNLPDYQPVSEQDLELCQNILKTFTHMGVLENFHSFVEFICKKYNWTYQDDGNRLNANTKSSIMPLSESEKALLDKKNFYDNRLYEWVVSQAPIAT